jgi:tetratricopeptide (TPR) repeat protein
VQEKRPSNPDLEVAADHSSNLDSTFDNGSKPDLEEPNTLDAEHTSPSTFKNAAMASSQIPSDSVSSNSTVANSTPTVQLPQAEPESTLNPLHIKPAAPLGWRVAGAASLLIAGCLAASIWDGSPRDLAAPMPEAQAHATTVPFSLEDLKGSTPESSQNSDINGLVPGLSAQATPSPSTGKPERKPTSPQASSPNAADTATFDHAVEAQKAGKAAEAIDGYTAELRKNPNNLSAHTNLAMLYLQSREPQKAVFHLKTAQRLDPKNPAAPFQLAQLLMQLGRPAEALKPVRQAIRLAPNNPAGHALLAQVYASQNKAAESYRAWVKASDLAPNDAANAFSAGVMAFEGLRKLPEAERYVRRAIKLEGRDARGPLYLGRILAARGKLADAEKTLESGARRFSKVPELWMALAEVRRARKDSDGSIAAFRSAAKALPPNAGPAAAPVWLELGRSLGSAKRWNEAKAALVRATQLVPRDPTSRALLAEVRLQSGDKSGAIRDFERALQIEPRLVAERRRLAQLFAHQKRWGQARAAYQKYIAMQPRDVEALVELAQVEEESGRSVAALAVWKRAERVIPTNPYPQLQSARLLESLKRDREALATYERVLTFAPKDPNALLGAAKLEEKAKQNARALSHWRTLILARPGYAPAYDALLRVSKQNDQLVATANALKPIVTKNPGNDKAIATLLRLYERAGQVETGRTFIKGLTASQARNIVLRRELDEFDLARAKKKLEELEREKQPTRPEPAVPSATPRPQDSAAIPGRPSETTADSAPKPVVPEDIKASDTHN